METEEKIIAPLSLNDTQKLAFDNIKKSFNLIHGYNYIAHEVMVETVDMMADQKRNRFIVGKLVKKAENVWDKYYDIVWKSMDDNQRSWYVDFGNNLFRRLEKKINFLIGVVCENTKKGKIRTPDDMLYARSIVTRIMFVDAATRFRMYFEAFNDFCNMDFSHLFKYADMTEIASLWDRVVVELRRRQLANIWENPECVNAYDDFMICLKNDDELGNDLIDADLKNGRMNEVANAIRSMQGNIKIK